MPINLVNSRQTPRLLDELFILLDRRTAISRDTTVDPGALVDRCARA